MNEAILDGYGNPFPLEAQERHLVAVLAALYLPPEETIRDIIEVEWKDKPAGHYNKGSGI